MRDKTHEHDEDPDHAEDEAGVHGNTRHSAAGVEAPPPKDKPTPSGLPRVDTIPELPNRTG